MFKLIITICILGAEPPCQNFMEDPSEFRFQTVSACQDHGKELIAKLATKVTAPMNSAIICTVEVDKSIIEKLLPRPTTRPPGHIYPQRRV